MTSIKSRLIGRTGGILILTLLLPILVAPFLAARIVVLAIFALGYNLLLGYSGELSFGHAAFFGFGGYMILLVMHNLEVGIFIAIVITLLASLIFSIVFAFLSLRRRGLYLAMITLALAQMLYFMVFQFNEITGGLDGLGMPARDLYIGPINILDSGLGFFLFGFLCFTLILLGLARIVDSPFGKVLLAIRENEQRALHLGYDPQKFLLLSFTMSGLISCFAGILYVMLYLFITPDVLFWTMSGTIVLMTIFGGIGALIGPVIGVIIFVTLEEILIEVTQHHPFIFGLFIIGIVIFAPRGLIGIYEDYIADSIGRNVERLRNRL